MVAPGYFASTAFSTDAFVSPVSSVSSDRCGCGGATGVPAELSVGLWGAVVVPVSAAFALRVPARMPPATGPVATRPAAPAARFHVFGSVIRPPGTPGPAGRGRPGPPSLRPLAGTCRARANTRSAAGPGPGPGVARAKPRRGAGRGPAPAGPGGGRRLQQRKGAPGDQVRQRHDARG